MKRLAPRGHEARRRAIRFSKNPEMTKAAEARGLGGFFTQKRGKIALGAALQQGVGGARANGLARAPRVQRRHFFAAREIDEWSKMELHSSGGFYAPRSKESRANGISSCGDCNHSQRDRR